MATEEAAELEGSIVGLIVGDGAGRYFAISWDDLLRFRVPAPYESVVGMLVDGADVAVEQTDVRGFADAAPATRIDRFLAEAAAAAPGRARVATRRLGAWAMIQ